MSGNDRSTEEKARAVADAILGPEDISECLPEGVRKEVITDSLLDGDDCQPKKGDEVHINYVGTLEDGTQFDSSRDRPGNFNFKLGHGEVNRGLDLGVATMRKGECAKFTLSPAFAYGAKGAPPKIPPNATLTFEVELLWWTRENALVKDGGVVKVVEKEGTGLRRPTRHSTVRMRYAGFVAGIEFTQSPEDGVEFELSGDNSMGLPIKTMELMLSSMLRHEVSLFRLTAPHAYGDKPAFDGLISKGSTVSFQLSLLDIFDIRECGFLKEKREGEHDRFFPSVKLKEIRQGTNPEKPNDLSSVTALVNGVEHTWTLTLGNRCEVIECAIVAMSKGSKAIVTTDDVAMCKDSELGMAPKEGPVVLELELINFEKATEVWNLSPQQKLERSESLKVRAASFMTAQEYRRACRAYMEVQTLLGYIDDWDDGASKASAQSLRQACKSNEVLTYLKLERWRNAIDLAAEILKGGGFSKPDPDNVKALYRRGQAYLGRQELSNAEQDFNSVLANDPGNAEAKRQLLKTKSLMKEERKKEQGLFKSMAGEVGKLDYPVGCTTTEGDKEREREAMMDRVSEIKAKGLGCGSIED